MDIKQLVTGNPKTGFYPVTQDTITVIELNKSVMSLTNESSSEEIIAAFDNLEFFQALIAEVRNPQNICSGILVNETPEDKRVGKYEATIIANTDAETLHVRWVENDRIIALSITNTDGTMSCIRNENNIGGGSGESDIYIFSPQGDPITLEEYTALENAIKENKIILYSSGDVRYIIINFMTDGNNIALIIQDYNKIVQLIINKEDLKLNATNIKLITANDVLTKDNTTEFTPDADYEPATKKYVDDKVASGADVQSYRVLNLNSDTPLEIGKKVQAATYGYKPDGVLSPSELKVNEVFVFHAPVLKDGETRTLDCIGIKFSENEIDVVSTTMLGSSDGSSYTHYVVNIYYAIAQDQIGYVIEEFDGTNAGGGSNEINILNDTFTKLINNITSASSSDIFNYTLTEEEYNYIINCIGKKNILPSDGVYHTFTNVEINKINYEGLNAIIIKYIDTPSTKGVYSSNVNIIINTNKEVEVFVYNVTGYNIDKNKISIPLSYVNCSKGSKPEKDIATESFKLYKVITESEYTALGDAPLTDNILYFVTPDE